MYLHADTLRSFGPTLRRLLHAGLVGSLLLLTSPWLATAHAQCGAGGGSGGGGGGGGGRGGGPGGGGQGMAMMGGGGGGRMGGGMGMSQSSVAGTAGTTGSSSAATSQAMMSVMMQQRMQMNQMRAQMQRQQQALTRANKQLALQNARLRALQKSREAGIVDSTSLASTKTRNSGSIPQVTSRNDRASRTSAPSSTKSKPGTSIASSF